MDLLQEKKDNVGILTLNRPEKFNAFDEALIAELSKAIKAFEQDVDVNIILLKGQGKHFSAGADIAWMTRMSKASVKENEADALKLAELLSTLYYAKKPTVVQVQGMTFGGGLGLIAACDIAVSTLDATFCFSEVKLGIVPAVISPYIIQAMGARAAKCLFMTAKSFSAEEAKALGLIQYCVEPSLLENTVSELIKTLKQYPKEALQACKDLVRAVQGRPIDATLNTLTAERIAKMRQSEEAKVYLNKFLKK